MEVNVKLFGDLREGRFVQNMTQIQDDSRVIDLINEHDLPLEHVGLCFVNCREAEFGQTLQNGDVVAFSPPVGGM
ncbi:MAG: MoaD/ThiS family protein [Syntrophomonas sp.]